MNIIPWRRKNNAVSHFDKLQTEMNKLFDDFFNNDFSLASYNNGRQSFMPSIDIKDTNKELKITVELPGMDEKDIDLSLTDGVLTIKGEKKHEAEDKKGDFHHIERSYGYFHRSIPLPCEIVEDKVSANFKKGVLSVSLPKSEKAISKSKSIEIKTS